MSTGGCGITLDRDSVSKAFQSRKKMNTCIHQYTGGQSGMGEIRIGDGAVGKSVSKFL